MLWALNHVSNPAKMHLQSEISILTLQNETFLVKNLQDDLSYPIHTEKQQVKFTQITQTSSFRCFKNILQTKLSNILITKWKCSDYSI